MRKALGAAVAGLAATLMMEYVSSFLYERHNEQVREREDQLRPEMPTTALARKLAGKTGSELSDQTAEQLGIILHDGFGAAGGPATTLLVSRGNDPLKAALTIATTMEIAVDQLANTALNLTAPTWQFPPVTQVRAVAARAAYGLALGLMLSASAEH